MKRAAAVALALLLLLSGCTESAQPEGPTGPLVYTDWSKLDGEETAPLVGSRWYDAYTGELIPHAYGTLIPYAGQRLAEGWPANTGCLYGLMTTGGVVVTDPVYSAVSRPGYWEGNTYRMAPVLTLTQGRKSGDSDMGVTAVYALAALNGSWCTGFDYLGVAASSDGLLLFREDGADWMTMDGTITRRWTPAELGLTKEQFRETLSAFAWGEGISGDWAGGWVTLCWAGEEADSLHIFRPADGACDTVSYDDWNAMDSGAEQNDEWEIRVEGSTTVLTRGEERVAMDHPVGENGIEIGAGVVCFRDDGLVYSMEGKKLFDFGPNRYVTFEVDRMLGREAPGLVLAYSPADTEVMEIEYYLPGGTKVATATPDDMMGEYWPQVSLSCGIVEVLERDRASYYEADGMTCIFRTGLDNFS